MEKYIRITEGAGSGKYFTKGKVYFRDGNLMSDNSSDRPGHNCSSDYIATNFLKLPEELQQTKVEEEIDVIDIPQPEGYYVMCKSSINPPKFVHSDLETAEKEAYRLSQLPNVHGEVKILMIIGTISKQPVCAVKPVYIRFTPDSGLPF